MVSLRALEIPRAGNSSPDRGAPTFRMALLRPGFGLSRERLPEVCGRWPAEILDDFLAFLEALQVQLNLLLVVRDDLASNRAQPLLSLGDFLRNSLEGEVNFGHLDLPGRRTEHSLDWRLGPIWGGVRGTAKV